MKLNALGQEVVVESAGFGGTANSPDLITLSNGNLLIVWTEVLGTPTDSFDDVDGGVFARVLDANGIPVGDILQINGASTGLQANPEAVALSAGSFAIGWSSYQTFGDHPADVDTYIRYFDSSGTPFNNFLIDVHQDTVPLATDDVLMEMVGLASGRIAVLLENETEEGYYTYIYDGAGAPLVQMSAPASDMIQLSNGNIVRADVIAPQVGSGEEGDHVQITMLSSRFTAPDDIPGVYDGLIFYIDGIEGNASKTPKQVQLAALAGGGFAVAYVEKTPGGSAVAVSVVTDDAQIEFETVPLSQTLSYLSPKVQIEMIALSGGGLALAVTTPDDSGGGVGLDLLLLDADGRMVDSHSLSVDQTGDQFQPSLTELPDGRIALAYTDDRADDPLQIQFFEVTGDGGRFIGTAGDDDLAGLGGNDRILGLAGNDTIKGGRGDDRLVGGDGDDTIFGGTGADSIRGQAGNDTLVGGGGADGIGGGAGDDVIRGGAGRDVLGGGSGADRLLGQAGNDVLIGGLGDDTLIGGGGRDTFRFVYDRSGDDVISDFDATRDKLWVDLRGNAAGDVTVDVVDGDTLVGFGDASVTLNGVTLTEAEITFTFV
ncbi:calcium-binding protein [Arenibacterium halophilum]|uniref:Calcium-binding protein n=1 Tax=Arenibacterium halophilum TaxID=2583821 RepID=A0ABY2XDL2_9RHOB|nr:calcium-binding protein [Arenibacterium halophilum]TMV14672.1 calcium-binding protein [Arenibacterium halophilum]